jgi:hypothetical protein
LPGGGGASDAHSIMAFAQIAGSTLGGVVGCRPSAGGGPGGGPSGDGPPDGDPLGPFGEGAGMPLSVMHFAKASKSGFVGAAEAGAAEVVVAVEVAEDAVDWLAPEPLPDEQAALAPISAATPTVSSVARKGLVNNAFLLLGGDGSDGRYRASSLVLAPGLRMPAAPWPRSAGRPRAAHQVQRAASAPRARPSIGRRRRAARWAEY